MKYFDRILHQCDDLIVKKNFDLSFKQYLSQCSGVFMVMITAYISSISTRAFFLSPLSVNKFTDIIVCSAIFVLVSLVGAKLFLQKDITFFVSLLKRRDE